MNYLWEDKSALKKQVMSDKPIALLLDFDGTLVPIESTPQKVVLPNSTRDLLRSLKNNSRIFLSIVSGRSLSDLIQKINILGISYSGNHGLEWEIDGKRHWLSGAEKIKNTLRYFKRNLDHIQELFPGTFVEDKEFTISIHYRLVAKTKAQKLRTYVKQLITRNKKDKQLFVLDGKKVLDISPYKHSMKSYFSRIFIKKIKQETKQNPLVIYIGDDTTDEDVFQRMKGIISIAVGTQPNSRATYYLRSSEEVVSFLGWLLNQSRMRF